MINTRAGMLLLPVFLILIGDACAQEKNKHALESLFEGVPPELQTKIKANAVRCDRVNDWLNSNLEGKGRKVELVVEVQRVAPFRRADKTYYVEIKLKPSWIKVLGDSWQVYLNGRDRKVLSPDDVNFRFEQVSSADAEQVTDAKKITLGGKVRAVSVPRFGAELVVAPIVIDLEEVMVDGKRWPAAPEKKAFKPGLPGGTSGDNAK